MNSRQWFTKLLLVTMLAVGLPVGSVMAFNYYIDPFWYFTHANEHNDKQLGFNERLQKSHWLDARAPLQADGIIIGTSRVTYMNSNNFEQNIFNYGLSSLHISEFVPYLQYAEQKNGRPFDVIYLELHARSYDTAYPAEFTNAEQLLAQVNTPFQAITHLFSNDTLQRAQENYALSATTDDAPVFRLYDRANQVTANPPKNDLVEFTRIFKVKQQRRADAGGFDDFYDPHYKAYLQQIKDAFPHAKIVPFNDAMLMAKFEVMLENDDVRAAYMRNVEEILDVFGVLYSFHKPSAISLDVDMHFDMYHFQVEAGDLLVKSLEQHESNDYMEVVTKENVSHYFAKIGINN